MRVTNPRPEGYPAIQELSAELGKPIFIFDTETSGFANNPKAEILEMACMSIDADGVVFYDTTLVKNLHPIPDVTINIHGITHDMAQTGMSFEEMHAQVEPFLNNSVVSGFNSRDYDIEMLRLGCERRGIDFTYPDQLDVRDIHIRTQNGSWKGKLGDICVKCGIPVVDAHQAMADVMMTAALLDNFVVRLGMETVLLDFRTAKPANVPTPRM